MPQNVQKHDFFIPPKSLGGGYNGDLVYALPTDEGDEAAVVRIVKRRETLVGTFSSRGPRHAFVSPDEREFLSDVHISPSGFGGAVTGDKVSVRLTAFPAGQPPEGEVTAVLGRSGDRETEELAVIAAAGIPVEFGEGVRRFVEEHDFSAINPADEEGREDFRGELTVTVDGEDARDLDDAITLKTCEKGDFLLGVHIADVSRYVEEGSALDAEAKARGTSVYFPDRVIPMLPRELSNGICSLCQDEDRLTLSCIMNVSADGKVLDSRFTPAVIRSDARLTYTEVDAVLSGDPAAKTRLARLVPMIESMNALAAAMHERRKKKGSVDLEVGESEILVGKDGITVRPAPRTAAHTIIEEFMLAANECAATLAAYAEIPFIYRVHEPPSEEKAAFFAQYLNMLGVRVRWNAADLRPYDFAALIDGPLRASPVFPLVNRAMLRSMNKAVYSDVNVGHFGLASQNYCHFTSPIRRYPDIVVHRAIKALISGGIGGWLQSPPDVKAVAESSSRAERRADEAERRVDDIFKAEYMQSKIGEEFDGIISGISAAGFFVELPDTVEGLVLREFLPRGDYTADRRNFTFSSPERCYSVGDGIRVICVAADITAGKVLFAPSDSPSFSSATPCARSSVNSSRPSSRSSVNSSRPFASSVVPSSRPAHGASKCNPASHSSHSSARSTSKSPRSSVHSATKHSRPSKPQKPPKSHKTAPSRNSRRRSDH